MTLTCKRCGFEIEDNDDRWATGGKLLAHMDEAHTPRAVEPAGFSKIPLMVDDEDRAMDWFTSSSAARIYRVVAFGQKILDERFADGAFE